MINLKANITNIYRLRLMFLGIILFVINGCRKCEDDPNNGGIKTEYGVRKSEYRELSDIQIDKEK